MGKGRKEEELRRRAEGRKGRARAERGSGQGEGGRAGKREEGRGCARSSNRKAEVAAIQNFDQPPLVNTKLKNLTKWFIKQ